nr:hypothetical protein [Tanacetum cinerariifolium]
VLPEAAPLRRTKPDEARLISSKFHIELVPKEPNKVHVYDIGFSGRLFVMGGIAEMIEFSGRLFVMGGIAEMVVW